MKTANHRWTALEGSRQMFIDRCETYAALTVPRICTPDEYRQDNDQLQKDWQSIGAQATNHLGNKLMLALFAPSRPFFRLEPSEMALAELEMQGMDQSAVAEVLSLAESKAVKLLDKKRLRQKLHEAVLHLIVTGNCLLHFSAKEGKSRIIGIKNYVVKRDGYGDVMEVIIRDCLTFEQLDEKVKRIPDLQRKHKDEDKVDLYKWIKRNANGDYELTQWVDDYMLPKEFNGKWSEENLPYRVLTWSLSDGADYGTGHVEDNVGDLEALSALAKAETEGAILASEYRWLANPAGMTAPEDIENSRNGAVIPGQDGDLTLISSGTTSALPHIQAIIKEHERRIAASFLLGTATIRNAERVTAEEVRMQATELETSLGGAYTRIAVELQLPLVRFLLDELDIKTGDGKEIEPVIITGLDGLSRNGDLENLKMWLGDMAALNGLPPGLLETLNMKAISSQLASGRNINSKPLLLADEQIAANQQARMNAQMNGAEGPQPGTAPTPAPGPQ